MDDSYDKFVQPWDGIVFVTRATEPRNMERGMEKIEIGDFIKIPAWRTEGQVINMRPASTLGTEMAQEVLLEVKPDDSHPRWYRLEPGEFEVIS